ncbi:hypothetical protein HDZ31DRAFT_81987 [Schizophyllum fasciatum]
MTSNTPANPLSADNVLEMQWICMRTALDFLFFGIQAALFAAAGTALVHHERRSRWLTAAITTLFISSTVAVIASQRYYLLQVPPYILIPNDPANLVTRLNIVSTLAWRYNYLVSDAIVVWRAWVLWPNSYIAKTVLLSGMCGTIAGIILEYAWSLHTFEATIRSLALTVPEVYVNLAATVLVGVQAWSYQRNIKSSFSPSTRMTQVQKVLLLLVESGFLYVLIWTFFLVIILLEIPSFPYFIIGSIYHDIAGIYPTFIILVVGLQRSVTETLLEPQASHTIHFACDNAQTPVIDDDITAQDITTHGGEINEWSPSSQLTRFSESGQEATHKGWCDEIVMTPMTSSSQRSHSPKRVSM